MTRKRKKGQVISKSAKTISVLIERTRRHPKYLKMVKIHRKILAHDEKQSAQLLDFVEIVESKPVSKKKSWVLKEIIK